VVGFLGVYAEGWNVGKCGWKMGEISVMGRLCPNRYRAGS